MPLTVTLYFASSVVLMSALSDDLQRVLINDFVYTFVRRCQVHCLYDGFPSDEMYRKTLMEKYLQLDRH